MAMRGRRKGERYGGRQCMSRYGRPSHTMGLRVPEEYREFIRARIDAGDARTASEYILMLVRAEASRLGFDL